MKCLLWAQYHARCLGGEEQKMPLLNKEAPSFGSLNQGSLALRVLGVQVEENTGQGSPLRAKGHLCAKLPGTWLASWLGHGIIMPDTRPLASRTHIPTLAQAYP